MFRITRQQKQNSMSRICVFTVVILLFLTISGKPQSSSRVDSLTVELSKTTDNITRVAILNSIANELSNVDYIEAKKNAQLAYDISKKISYYEGEAHALRLLGYIEYNNKNYDEAVNYYERNLTVLQRIKDTKLFPNTYNSLGNVYMVKGNYMQALDYYLKCLEIVEKQNDKNGIATTASSIGKIYFYLVDYKQAITYYRLSLKMFVSIKDKLQEAQTYDNLAEVYRADGDHKTAMDYLLKSADIILDAGNEVQLATVYRNIGRNYYYAKQYDEADAHLQLSLMTSKKLNHTYGLAYDYTYLGSVYNAKGDYKKAIELYTEAYTILTKVWEVPELLSEVTLGLSIANGALENYTEAYLFHVRHKTLSDELTNKEKTKKITELQMRFEFKQQQEKNVADLKRQKTIRNFLFGGFVLVLLFAIYVFRSFRIKQRDNRLLAAQKEEIQKQAAQLNITNSELEKKNIQIMDSINYAKHIQDAILPTEHEFSKYLPDSFIYFRPRDVVSGDFYWFSIVDDLIVVAAIDCTGHGVPGAFMSMIGNTLLNEIINDKRITRPDIVLNELHIGVSNALRQTGEDSESEDGMDMALCCIDVANKKILFAGAKNPMYVIKDRKLNIIKADYHSIGEIPIKKEIKVRFTLKEIAIEPDTAIYMFSDGYMDQFGGTRDTKFNTPQFNELLINNFDLPMKEQKRVLDEAMKKWQGTTKQIDDMLVMGFRFK